jgi:ABC-type multidrug transport system ATPase subunit
VLPGAEPAPPVGSAGPVLRAVGLEVGYGLPVCAPITLELSAGECVAVLGPNGSGKSTFLLSVVGLRPPLGGSLEVLGGAVDERAASFRAAVSSAMGDDAFFPALTVREHVQLTAHGHGVAEPDELVEGLLTEFGLTGRADALPSALSSGQRRRLLLAAALARPRSLVLDEPEQRLDAGMRRRLAHRLVEECAGGGAVLLACHDAELVAAAATSALLLTEAAAEVVSAADGAAALSGL